MATAKQAIRNVAAVLVSGMFLLAGCNQGPPAMSYQEALAIYTSEMELLNSLKSRRLALSTTLEQLHAGGLGDSAAQLAGSLLQGAAESKAKVGQTLDQFSELKDLLPEDAQKAADQTAAQTDALTKQLTDQVKSAQEGYEAQKKKIEAEITELDQQITAQQEKVDRALKDKQDAEARR